MFPMGAWGWRPWLSHHVPPKQNPSGDGAEVAQSVSISRGERRKGEASYLDAVQQWYDKRPGDKSVTSACLRLVARSRKGLQASWPAGSRTKMYSFHNG